MKHQTFASIAVLPSKQGKESMKIEEVLTQLYGPLLSVVQLAKILHRSAEGLRISLRTESDWSKRVNAAKLKLN